MAQWVKGPTLAQVMISVSSSPALGSVLTAQTRPALDSGSPSLSAPPLLTLSQNNKQTFKKEFFLMALYKAG